MPTFKDVLGQPHIKQEIRRAIAENKVSHAYMIAGEALTGKKFIARVIAQTLLCEKPVQTDEGLEPCCVCVGCKKAEKNAHPDLRIVEHEKDSPLSVDIIREQLVNSCYLMPMAGSRKVYIVPDAEMMSTIVQNKLLKTLEEPPAYATIILLTTSADKMLPTIRSRCVTFGMQPVEDALLKQYLMGECGVSAVHTEFAVRFAGGSAGRAISLSEKKDFAERARRITNLMTELQNMDIARIDREMQEIFGKECKDISAREEFFYIARCYFRDIMLVRATGNAENLILRDKAEYIRLVADHTSFMRLTRINDALDDVKRRIKQNVNPVFALQFFILQMRAILTTT